MVTTSRINPSLFSKMEFLDDIIILDKSPKFIIKMVFSYFFGKKVDVAIDFDQYYSVSELLSTFAENSFGYRTNLKGKSFSKTINYDTQLNERYVFKNLSDEMVRSYDLNHYIKFDYNYALDSLSDISEDFWNHKDFSEYELCKLPLIVIYAGSSKNATFRRWPAERFRKLIKKLQGQAFFFIAGGPDEISLIPYFNNLKNCSVLINELSLMQWAWIFKHKAQLLIGNDGGLIHLAETQNLPTIGIFGPGLYKKWGSINPQSIPCEVELFCRPCLKNYERKIPQKCWRGSTECLDLITVKYVYDNVQIFLKKKKY